MTFYTQFQLHSFNLFWRGDSQNVCCKYDLVSWYYLIAVKVSQHLRNTNSTFQVGIIFPFDCHVYASVAFASPSGYLCSLCSVASSNEYTFAHRFAIVMLNFMTPGNILQLGLDLCSLAFISNVACWKKQSPPLIKGHQKLDQSAIIYD